jgi:hypothetical protein
MLQSSPTHELDRIIAKAQEARTQLRGLIEGVTPDENGVVTSTVETAVARAEEFRAEAASLGHAGLAVSAVIDDLHLQTSGAFEQATVLGQRIDGRLDRSSVGHADGALASIVSDEPVVEEPGGVTVSTESVDDQVSGTSYYGV